MRTLDLHSRAERVDCNSAVDQSLVKRKVLLMGAKDQAAKRQMDTEPPP